MKVLHVVLLSIAPFVAPQAAATDISDLWWNPDESGWGVNVAHQGNVLFLTFFVYGQNGQPLWLVGSNTAYEGTTETGTAIFQGPLYQTTGSWFGGTFNPAAVTLTEVGTVTWTMNTNVTATVRYSVNGLTVTKSVARQTFRNNPRLAGSYYGGMVRDASGCQASGHFESAGQLDFSLVDSTAQIVLQIDRGTCTFSGRYAQSGQMGRVPGTVSCNFAGSGTATVFEIEAGTSGLTARYQADYGAGCTEVGWFGGARR